MPVRYESSIHMCNMLSEIVLKIFFPELHFFQNFPKKNSKIKNSKAMGGLRNVSKYRTSYAAFMSETSLYVEPQMVVSFAMFYGKISIMFAMRTEPFSSINLDSFNLDIHMHTQESNIFINVEKAIGRKFFEKPLPNFS